MDKSENNAGEFVAYPVGREKKCTSVTGVILAGGNSRRMRSNKALLRFRGELFIERIHRQLSTVFTNILLVTNTPDLYRFLPCPTVPDIYPGMGCLAGIHAGLKNSENPFIFVVACDMPHLNTGLIRYLVAAINGQELIMPESDEGMEPLHAVYGKEALPKIEEALHNGNRKTVSCCEQLKSTIISRDTVARFDPRFLSFRNINTPEDFFCFNEELKNIGENEKLSEPETMMEKL